jgi:hypothetical protein
MKRYLLATAVVILLLFLLVGGALSYRYLVNHGLNFDFDPALMAESETIMWQAYYTRDDTALGMALVKMLNEQFGLTVIEAAELGEPLARTAMAFARASGDYEQSVLPGLVNFYTRVRDLSGGTWNPDEVARAELAWWVARRTPGEDSPENVGRLIADLYAKLYGASNVHIERAGLLRAQAAAIRDAAGPNADWVRIQAILTDSFTELRTGIALAD